jgi:hypothetical protein
LTFATFDADATIYSSDPDGWFNYTVTGAGTQIFNLGAVPKTVYVDGAEQDAYYGWSATADGVVTVTDATVSVAAYFEGSSTSTLTGLTVLSASPGTGLSLNSPVTLSWTFTVNDMPVTNYLVNVTRDGTMWQTNYALSSVTDVSAYPVSHVYRVVGLYDLDTGNQINVDATITVTWSVSGGPFYPDPNATPTPQTSATAEPPNVQNDVFSIIAQNPVIAVAVALVVAVAVGVVLMKRR